MTEPQVFRWLQLIAIDHRSAMLLVVTAVLQHALTGVVVLAVGISLSGRARHPVAAC